VPFDAVWFSELRQLSDDRLSHTRLRGIAGFVPHVGELCRDGHVTDYFLDETTRFVSFIEETQYRLDTFFRAYKRHVVNFPRGRAFRKQWNVGFSADGDPGGDFVRLGIGFRLSGYEEARGIQDYLEFREHIRNHREAFDRLFQPPGNYYEIMDWEPAGRDESANHIPLSDVVVADQPPLDGWRFFGRRLWVRDPQDQAVIGSHTRLRDAAVDIFTRIQAAGFGM
jgi:hypothetical protein